MIKYEYNIPTRKPTEPILIPYPIRLNNMNIGNTIKVGVCHIDPVIDFTPILEKVSSPIIIRRKMLIIKKKKIYNKYIYTITSNN